MVKMTKSYTSKKLSLLEEDCQNRPNATLQRFLYRLDVEFAKEDFDENFDVYYEALWRK
jgi:hypothetical protein